MRCFRLDAVRIDRERHIHPLIAPSLPRSLACSPPIPLQIEQKRINQNAAAMWSQLSTQLSASARRNDKVVSLSHRLDDAMKRGGITHRRAGRELLEEYIRDEYEHLQRTGKL